jgi:hypothetical protein
MPTVCVCLSSESDGRAMDDNQKGNHDGERTFAGIQLATPFDVSCSASDFKVSNIEIRLQSFLLSALTASRTSVALRDFSVLHYNNKAAINYRSTNQTGFLSVSLFVGVGGGKTKVKQYEMIAERSTAFDWNPQRSKVINYVFEKKCSEGKSQNLNSRVGGNRERNVNSYKPRMNLFRYGFHRLIASASHTRSLE